MNIFVTDKDPVISAQALDDKRVIKMALETAQLLSSAIFINDNMTRHDEIYKPTHLKHPCTIWASASSENWSWLYEHFTALCQEYNFRYNKYHACLKISEHLLNLRHHIKEGSLTPFANCTHSEAMQIDFRDMSDTFEAYRKYLIAKWKYDKVKPKWTNREKPLWYKEKSLHKFT